MKSLKTNYLAVIGDVIDSKKLKNREKAQSQILDAFGKIHALYPALIISKFTMTVGDEFQALLKPQASIWQLLDQLAVFVPFPFRLGLGLGEISTQINPELSIGADGEAYWHARDAIQTVHTQDWNNKSHVLFKGSSSQDNEVINSLILAGETLKSEWNNTSWTTFEALLDQGVYQVDFVQKDIAKNIGISPQTLSKRLITGNIKVYFQIRETLGRLLEDYGESTQ